MYCEYPTDDKESTLYGYEAEKAGLTRATNFRPYNDIEKGGAKDF